MSYQSLFMLATAGITITATFFMLDRVQRAKARGDHYRARLRGQITRAYVKAEKMVQHRGLTTEQRTLVRHYIDRMEQMHYDLGLGHTERFNRLRQTLVRNNNHVSVVV